MGRDIVVTTPKSQIVQAEAEAEWAKAQGGGPGIIYFRRINRIPKDIELGDKVFYVEDGYVRGYCILAGIDPLDGVNSAMDGKCQVTKKDWGDGPCLVMRADSWKWIEPIRMKGFQGWRYWDGRPIKVVGGWKDKKPKPK